MSDQSVILLAEDREDDILLVQRPFKKAFINNPLYVVRDGEEAIAYLSGTGKFSNRSEYPLPDLLLLDLKMPRVDGFEVLKWLRRQPGLDAPRIDTSDHVLFVNDQLAVRFIEEIDFDYCAEDATAAMFTGATS